MKTTHKSQKRHWAVGYEITCRKCTSQFMAEDEYDFQDGFDSDYIYIQCPECGQKQKVFKPRPSTIPKVLSDNKTITWKLAVDEHPRVT